MWERRKSRSLPDSNTACSNENDSKAQPGTVSLRLIQTSDIHSNVLGYDYYQNKEDRKFGLSRTALLIRAARAAPSAPAAAPAQAVGPVKVQLLNPVYTAIPCPSDKPIPGEKAMKGLRGLCVTVKADLAEAPPKVC